MAADFIIRRYFSEGWALYKKSAANMSVSAFVMIVVIIGLNMIPVVNFFAGVVMPGVFSGGMTCIMLDAVRGEKFNIKRLFGGFDKIVPLTLVYVLSNVFAGIPVFISTMVSVFFFDMDKTALGVIVIIPGVVAFLMIAGWYMFSYFFVMEQDMGFWDAMEASRKIGRANNFKIILFELALGTILMGGVFALGIGVLVSLPLMYAIAFAAYRHQIGQPVSADVSISDLTPLPQPFFTETEVIQSDYHNSTIELDKLKEYVHCFVFIEGEKPSQESAIRAIRSAAPGALAQAEKPAVTGRGVAQWPSDDPGLKKLVKTAMAEYRATHPDSPNYNDPQRFTVKVWKGRDHTGNANVAVASVIDKTV